MAVRSFLDTNILVYATSRAEEDAEKRRIAGELVATTEVHLSLQVVQEFIHVCQRKRRLGSDADALRRSVERMLDFPCHLPGPDSVLKALDLQRDHRLSFWDASILVAALESGCKVLYTEDLNHGQNIEGVRVVNPFRTTVLDR